MDNQLVGYEHEEGREHDHRIHLDDEVFEHQDTRHWSRLHFNPKPYLIICPERRETLPRYH